MGHVHTFTNTATTATVRRLPIARAVDCLVGGLLLVLTLPLMGIFALAVSRSSNGPILHRHRGLDGRGRPVELLSFRTMLDGGGTVTHERLRAVIGADGLPLTPVGRVLRATRLERLPRLFNLLAGHISLF